MQSGIQGKTFVANAIATAGTPNIRIYTDHEEYTGVDHSVQFSGVWPFSKLVLGFSQGFTEATSEVLGVSDLVVNRSYNTRLTSRYEVSQKTSAEVNGSMGRDCSAQRLASTGLARAV